MKRGLDDARFKASDTSMMPGASPDHTAPSRQIWLWTILFPLKHPGSLSGLKTAALVCLFINSRFSYCLGFPGGSSSCGGILEL